MKFTINELNKSKYYTEIIHVRDKGINNRTKIDFVQNEETYIVKLKTGFITLILN